MSYHVDGFDLKFTSRTSWKAERRRNGELLDVVPVAWANDWRQADGPFLGVWLRNGQELTRPEPFIVAVAKAKDYKALPHEVASIVGVFKVVPTGNIWRERSRTSLLETRVLKRITAR
jgi:hypothetical protein